MLLYALEQVGGAGMGTAVVEPADAKRSRYGKRAARAAGVGLVAMAASVLATWLLLDSSACQDAPGYGCIGYAVLWLYLLPVLYFLLTWSALRVLAVRPAWLTALLGTAGIWSAASMPSGGCPVAHRTSKPACARLPSPWRPGSPSHAGRSGREQLWPSVWLC